MRRKPERDFLFKSYFKFYQKMHVCAKNCMDIYSTVLATYLLSWRTQRFQFDRSCLHVCVERVNWFSQRKHRGWGTEELRITTTFGKWWPNKSRWCQFLMFCQWTDKVAMPLYSGWTQQTLMEKKLRISTATSLLCEPKHTAY